MKVCTTFLPPLFGIARFTTNKSGTIGGNISQTIRLSLFSGAKRSKATFSGRPGSPGLWFNLHPRHVEAFWDKMLNDAYFCLVKLKEVANYLDKISNNKRNLGTRNLLSGWRLIVQNISTSGVASRDRRINMQENKQTSNCFK